MGPISHTGPKTSRAARDRPEPNPREQTSHHDIAGDSPERRPTGGAATKNARGAKRTLGRNIVRASRGQRAPSRNQRPSCTAASINASARLHRDTAPSEFQQRPANIGATARPARGCDAR
ncbi:alpha,alpha-trehalose-phosphate synthase [Dorcoceras hygrometricum]|uniref:Alpha,alpha-trehalose-phosphate synthase n=1 Tax=Dorcoceras hygrometricum TaxID=472368 RepID=A0A2Z6ZS75_9LAMI|nr:alpha,alpha-trehalose-phosphate synthase [Dorcoceras hygrometricum]